jgi:Carboxypeptidase regulatory-like domain/TonB-dependent Receptor Plug Domain/TonB dependent receptor
LISRCFRQIVPFFVGLLLVGAAQGQINNASLSGLVTDQTKAAIVHAKVTISNSATGYSREFESDASGYFSFQDLPIGEYKIAVSVENFQSVESSVALGTAEKVRRDFVLKLGSILTSIEVDAATTNLAADASISTIVDNETIRDTPLYLRNWDDLLRMVPGVQINRFTQQSGATSAGRTGSFNVHGIHSLQNNFVLDGIDNNTFSENVQELSTEASHPSVDAIQEFNVVTNPYSAEFGRNPGATVSVNTKSGTNGYHGLAYEYLRNNLFDANDFISNANGLKKPENNQNQFGGNFGGPILKKKLFGFFDYEGTRIRQGVSRVSTVPLANERIGDFSPETAAAFNTANPGLNLTYPTIYDLLATPSDPSPTGLAFPDNKIPQASIDPVMARLIALFPQPTKMTDVNNYVRNALLTDSTDAYDGRLDWTATAKDNVFGRFSYSNRARFIPGYIGGIADATGTSAWGRQTLKSYSLALGWTHSFSPVLVNEFRLGFVRNYSFAEQDPFGKNLADAYVPGIPDNPAVQGGVPNTSFSNFGFLGSPDFLPKRQTPQQYEWTDTVSWTRGAHAFKFGFNLWAPMRNIYQDEPGTRGDLNFTGNFTCQRDSNNQCVSNTGLSYADGLLGLVHDNQLTNVFFVDQRLWMLAGFLQDDWKVTHKLTLDLGLRYDFATPALEGQNRMANFDPVTSSLVFAKSGSLESRSLVQPNKKNFGPRVGFAYLLDPKTVVRGGYGIYYVLFERYGSENQMALNPPYLINKVLANDNAPVMIAQNGFPANFLDPSAVNLNDLTAFDIRSMNRHDPSSMVQQWSLGVQHQFGTQWLAEVNYVGTKSDHLDTLTNYNQPLFVKDQTTGASTSTGVVPYANFGEIEFTSPSAHGHYNGLEASLARRFSDGLSLRTAYTYSRSRDNAPEELENNSGGPPDGRNFGAWYGPSDFDIPHRVALSASYELPFGARKAYLNQGITSTILGGFQLSGVYTYYSGHPFTVTEGGSLANSLDVYGMATAVPNLVGKPVIVGDPNCWFYASSNSACSARRPSLTDAYVTTAPGVAGNSGRNTLRGPSTNVFDFSLIRNFHLYESTNLQFRWEVFNLFNHPLFGQPNGNVTSGGAGQITTLSGDPRVMQFALRLSF